MSNLKLIATILLFAVGVAFGMLIVSKCNPSPPEVITDTTYIYDTIPQIDTFVYPVPYVVIKWKDKWQYDTAYFDTTKCCDYLSELKLYNRVLRDDTSMTVVLDDSVHFNSLLGYKLYTRNNRATQIIINQPVIDNTKYKSLYIDAGIKYKPSETLIGLGGTFAYKWGKTSLMVLNDKSAMLVQGFTIK